jgi:hypothetical protein
MSARSQRAGKRRRSSRLTVIVAAIATLLAAPVALGAGPTATPATPGQRIDLKVLVVAQNADQAAEWKTQLAREGLPYDTILTSSAGAITDAKLADYATNHAKYQAVIVAYGSATDPAVLPAADEAALNKFEKTFGIRQLSDLPIPNSTHGLNAPASSGAQDGNVATLTAVGKQAFPYLKDQVPIANDDPAVDETWGHQATPAPGADFETLLTGPNNSSYLGIDKHPDGREEMVMTVGSNQYQIHNQLLRHGMISWVTRGVYLGYQRNYLEMHVDDVFLGDDSWDTATNTTNYDPAAAIRMSAADVTKAVQWSQQTGLTLDMVFNGAGNVQNGGASDPLLTALKANKGAFRWINHTYEHPNLDCSTQSYIANQINQNTTWATANGFGDAVDKTELVTGEHSGLANLVPGNPGTIDPPTLDDAGAGTGAGTLAAGTYEYGVSAHTAKGETPASTTNVTVGANATVTVQWGAVCHATSYDVYRRTPAGTGAWTKVNAAPIAQPAAPATDTGAATVAFTDTGAAGTAASPPAANTATVDPYGQNPNLLGALTSTAVKYAGSDASKPYPQTPTNVGSPQYPAGTTFFQGDVQAVPRYPTNVYYNAAAQEQQLDEYNWIYVADNPATTAIEGNCQASAVTTCRSAPATWDQYIASEASIMFRHVVGNDPRPHYFHQTNIAETGSTGGTLYKLVDKLKADYDKYYAANAPLVQLSQHQIGDELKRQADWQKASAQVEAYVQDGQVHVSAPAGTQVPLTGTTEGTSYGGQKSGWVTATGSQVFTPSDPANTAAPTVTGSVAQLGATLTANPGTWGPTAPVVYAYQWQRCNAQGESCQSIVGATTSTYTTQAADKDQRLRVVVSAGNWISSYSRASSAATDVVGKPVDPPKVDPPKVDPPKVEPPKADPPQSAPPSQGSPGATPAPAPALALSNLRMTPKRFKLAKRSGARHSGSSIAWRLNKAATIRLRVQRKARDGRRWVTVGTIATKPALAGTGSVRFTGRVSRRWLSRGSYRLVATASAGGEKTAPKRLSFRVVRG